MKKPTYLTPDNKVRWLEDCIQDVAAAISSANNSAEPRRATPDVGSG